MTASSLTRTRSTPRQRPAGAVLVLEPPRHVDMPPLLLSPGVYELGSHSDCDFVIDADGVALQHVRMEVTAHRLTLTALDCRTWVNDFLVKDTALRRGDRISLGPLTFTLRAATPDDLLTLLPDTLDLEPAVAATNLDPQPEQKTIVEAVQEEAPAAITVASPASVAVVAERSEVENAEPVATTVSETALPLEPKLPPAAEPLDEQIAEWQRERLEQERELNELRTQLAALAAGLEERETRLQAFEERLTRREDVLDQRQAEFDAQRTALDARETALTEERVRLENVAHHARAELQSEAEKQAVAWAEWEASQRKLTAQLNAQFAEIAAAEARCSAAKAELDADQQAWLQTRCDWESELAQWEARREEQQLELAQREAEVEQQRDDLTRHRSDIERQRADLHAEACQRASAHRELFEAREATQRERRLFAEQQAAWMEEREAQWNELRERRRRLDADERDLAELQSEIERVREELKAQRAALASTRPAVDEMPAASQIADITPAPIEPTIPTCDDPIIEETETKTEPEAVNEAIALIPSAVEIEPAVADDLSSGAAAEPLPQTWAEAWNSPTECPVASELVTESVGLHEPTNLLPPLLPEALALAETVEMPPIPQDLPAHDAAASTELFSESFSTPPVSPADAEEDDLHAKLAKMFGLPEDFGHQAAVDSKEDGPEVWEPAEAREATDEPRVDLVAEDGTDGDDEDEEWRARLAQMLVATKEEVAVEPAAIKPVPVTPPPLPTNKSASPSATTEHAEEDSIAAYMERLLARNKMGSGSDDAPSAAKSPAAEPVHPAASASTSVTPTHDTDSENDETDEADTAKVSFEVRPRADKDEVRAALQSFRQVANLSARSALAKHSSKAIRGELAVQGVLTGLASIAAMGYWSGPLWGGSVQPLQATGCLIAAGWMGWQIKQSLHRLKNWNPNDHLLSTNSDEDTGTEMVATTTEDATSNAMPSDPDAIRHEFEAPPTIDTVETAEPEIDELAEINDAVSLEEAAGAEPMGGMIGPRGDL